MSKVCSKCGGAAKPGAVKCMYCGSPLIEESARPSGSGSQGVNPPRQSNQGATVQPPRPTTPPPAPQRPVNPQPQRPAAQPPQRPAAPQQPTAPRPATPRPSGAFNGGSLSGISLDSGRVTTATKPDLTEPLVPPPPSRASSSRSSIGIKDGYDGLSRDNWSAYWTEKKRRSKKLGLILTNLDGLKNPSRFVNALNAYITKKSSEGIEYCFLDLKEQGICNIIQNNCGAIIDLLKKIYSVAIPDYLLIVGDHATVPCAEWENEARDSDKTVPSDLAYITLDKDSPFDGADYSFSNLTQVGRIPTSRANDFEEAAMYFENTAKFKPYTSTKAFAYSALVWEKTSKTEFAAVSPMMITSPQYTSNSATARSNGLTLIESIGNAYSLLCFNLHGSDSSHVWYGQEGKFYPEAVAKKLFPKDTNGYVICTEACYGARPEITKGGEQSIIVHALTNKCVAFVGSTRIAYGRADGSMSCADIIAGSFTSSVAKGMTVGAAFLKSLGELSRGTMNEVAIKTLAEFALYGDPSVRLVASNSPETYSTVSNLSMAKTTKDPSRAFKLIPCDGSAAHGGMTLMNFSMHDQAKIQNMAHSIRETGKGYIMSNFSTMSSVEPQVYKVFGRAGYRAIYSKRENGMSTVIRMHVDDNGNVEDVYTSK